MHGLGGIIMRKPNFLVVLLAMLVALLTLPAPPASADDSKTCLHASDDDAIAACTRAIESRSFKGPKLATLYVERGHWYVMKVYNQLDKLDKASLDHALADFDESERIHPSVTCLICRCYARTIAGRLPEALSDCNEALRREPGSDSALGDRGLTYLKLGQFDKAIADYSAVLSQDAEDGDALYGRGIARLNKGDSGGSGDIEAAKRLDANVVQRHATLYGIQ
jgi:tetratricopeptide (TPR) repeat protein